MQNSWLAGGGGIVPFTDRMGPWLDWSVDPSLPDIKQQILSVSRPDVKNQAPSVLRFI